MSSITSKLIRNAPGPDGVAAEDSGPTNDTIPTSAINEAAAQGRVIISDICLWDLELLWFFFCLFVFKQQKERIRFSVILNVVWIFVPGSEEKTPKASTPHHAASSHAKQSPSLEVTDNDEEPAGDRWDDDEDWGSLEVGLYHITKAYI